VVGEQQSGLKTLTNHCPNFTGLLTPAMRAAPHTATTTATNPKTPSRNTHSPTPLPGSARRFGRRAITAHHPHTRSPDATQPRERFPYAAWCSHSLLGSLSSGAGGQLGWGRAPLRSDAGQVQADRV